ncbi:bifunctional DNA primase/polymerase [Streptomyces polyrhachis]|uniref:Bifunctional DNA primase/polymerase n=1 Tax=Streptomyces polyrhachis TaxID=1282885 RepID=A0ABW2GN92_9ACTN
MARWCAGQGWPVHPLAPGRKTPARNCPTCRERHHEAADCPCIPAGRWCHGFHAATTEPARIDTWWGAEPTLGVGVACGPADLVVIDVDAHQAPPPDRDRLLPGIPIDARVDLRGLATGFDTLALLAAYRGRPDPAEDEGTLRVRTPSGGLHVWYRAAGPRLRSSAGSSGRVALAWQVDVRAVGGYVVAPGTATEAGEYRPIGSVRTPAPLPQWLEAELVRTGHRVEDGSQPPAPPRRARPAAASGRGRPGAGPGGATRLLEPLLAEVADCAAAPRGTGFSEKLNRAAYTAGGLAAAGHLDEAAARELLNEAAGRARPRQPVRNRKIIADAMAAGAARPLHPKGRS